MQSNWLSVSEVILTILDVGGSCVFLLCLPGRALTMGREFANEEGACKRTGKVNSLVESLRSRYTDRLKESLRNYEFNFVISDPRLPENPIVYASEGFCNMSGYSRDEVLGRNCRFLQGPGTDRRTVLELRDAVREERSAQVRILNYTKEGKPFWNLFHLAPVFSKADGTVTHFVGVQTPISCELATSQPEKEITLSRPNLSSERGQLPLAVDELNDLHKNVGVDGGFPDPFCTKLDSADSDLNGSLNFFADSGRNVDRFVLSSSGMDMHGSETCAGHAIEPRLIDGGMGVSDACKPQEPESITATHATRSIVSQLVESSKGKGEVIESRDKQVSECSTSGVVCSSLLLSLTRIQQSFVLADPHLPDTPIVHASDLFLHLTGGKGPTEAKLSDVPSLRCYFELSASSTLLAMAQCHEQFHQHFAVAYIAWKPSTPQPLVHVSIAGYSREEVMGQNCRFLQGPGTDPASVAQIRESMRLEKSCSVRLLNYRKDKKPFWNLLHVSPVRCSKGKVSFYVGVQLHVSAVDKEEEEGIGMNGHQKQLGAVAAVRVAVRSLQGAGLRRTIIESASS